MGVELIVLDFDGTLTNVDKEGIPFVAGYKTDVAADLGISGNALDPLWAAKQAHIEANPSRYGWRRNGCIVAPAYADPMIMSLTIADLLLDEASMHTGDEARTAALDGYFQRNYGKLGIAFKEDANAFLNVLYDRYPAVCIVTNSKTEGVAKKIQHLPSDHSRIKIYGDAKKFDPRPDWTDVPEYVEREGYGRPLFLRRKQYWDVLTSIMGERGISDPSHVVVIGDINELDLVLPEYQGMNVILTPRDSTPAFEVEAVQSSPRGRIARSLDEVLHHLEAWR